MLTPAQRRNIRRIKLQERLLHRFHYAIYDVDVHANPQIAWAFTERVEHRANARRRPKAQP